MSKNKRTDYGAVDPASLKLSIPELWAKNWHEAMSESEGAERFLISIQARAAHLLKSISDHRVTFERLAWLQLWTKAFSLLDGARAATLRNSEYLLEVLSRIEFELVLQVHTIFEAESLERLKAYCAWCLSNDISFQRDLANPKTLEGLWDPKPVQELTGDPHLLEIHERLFGPIPVSEIETDKQAAKRGRFRQQNDETHRLRRMEAWLEDPSLRRWSSKLQQLRERKRHHPTFFELFDENEYSVAKRLHSMDKRFLYVAYLKGSMFVHGSTMEHLFHIENDVIAPCFVGSRRRVNELAEMVGKGCNNAMVLMGWMQRDLWPASASHGTGKLDDR